MGKQRFLDEVLVCTINIQFKNVNELIFKSGMLKPFFLSFLLSHCLADLN